MRSAINMGHSKPIMTSLRHLGNKIKPKKTCLYDFHVKRGARMELFADHSMPIVYGGQTITQEHLHTRQSVSAFDVSHMMQVLVTGRDTEKFIESITVADVQGMAIDKCTLSVFPNEQGGIIDDCVISKRPDHCHIVSNAGNSEIVWRWLNENLDKLKYQVKLDRQNGRGLIAVQGPKAHQVVQKFVNVDLREMLFMTSVTTQVATVANCQVTRCGYTGEDGFEISIPAQEAPQFMDELVRDKLVKPAGLGARDTLRLEAGLCLHGHDIDQSTTPIEAGLNWVIGKRRRSEGGFPGFDVIMDQLKNGSNRKRVGLVATQKSPPAREGSKILESPEGEPIGHVTSGTLSPNLMNNIAMGYVPPEIAKQIGKLVLCQVRGKLFEYRITKMPFVPANYYTKKH